MASMVNCPYCGKLTDPNLDACPHCGGTLQQSAPPGRTGRGRQTCPSCKAMVQDGDIICVVCGTNLLTGQKVREEVRAANTSSSSRTTLILGAGLVILIVVLGVMWYLVTSRDPLKQARQMIDRGELVEAQSVLLEHVDRVPDDAEALLELGRIQWQLDQYASAAESFERVTALNPLASDAALWTVAALELSGTPDRRKQIAQLRQVTQNEPDNVEVWYLLALTQGLIGNNEDQIVSLERVLTLSPLNSQAQLSLGIGYALQENWREAVRSLRLTAELEEEPDAQAVYGFIAHRQGDDESSVGYMEAAVGGEGISIRWETLTQLGKLLIEEGRFNDAQRYLDLATSLRPGTDVSDYLLGICLKAQNQQRAALQGLEEVMLLKGKLGRDAGVQVVDIYLSMGQVERARTALESLKIRDGDEDAAYYTVEGRLAVALGDEARAQDRFRRAINLDNSYAPAHLENGLIYVKRDALSQGLAELEEYLNLIGDDSEGTQASEVRELANQLRLTTG